MAVKFMIDSASDVLPSECKKLDAIHVPLTVRFGDKEFSDAVDLSAKKFYKMLISGKEAHPTTSQITPAAWAEAMEQVVSNGDTAVVGTMLNIKPLITVADGKVASIGKARGPKAADKQLRELVAKTNGIDFSKPFCTAYSGLEDDNQKVFLDESRELLCSTEAPVSGIGSVIGAHVGPGAVAIGYFEI